MSRLSKLFPKLFSYSREDSYITKLRQKRLGLVRGYFDQLSTGMTRPISLLDIGGGIIFWQQSGFLDPEEYHIALLNIDPPIIPEDIKGFSSIEGNACELDEKLCEKYDIAFSNSVIEHVGEDEDQKKMADLVQHNFDKYIVQTPNFWFPFEPHSQLPFFQFIPHCVRGLLIYVVGNINYFPKKDSYKECVAVSRTTRMLSKRKLRRLFPNAKIVTERIFGLPKSFIVIGGLDQKTS